MAVTIRDRPRPDTQEEKGYDCQRDHPRQIVQAAPAGQTDGAGAPARLCRGPVDPGGHPFSACRRFVRGGAAGGLRPLRSGFCGGGRLRIVGDGRPGGDLSGLGVSAGADPGAAVRLRRYADLCRGLRLLRLEAPAPPLGHATYGRNDQRRHRAHRPQSVGLDSLWDDRLRSGDRPHRGGLPVLCSGPGPLAPRAAGQAARPRRTGGAAGACGHGAAGPGPSAFDPGHLSGPVSGRPAGACRRQPGGQRPGNHSGGGAGGGHGPGVQRRPGVYHGLCAGRHGRRSHAGKGASRRRPGLCRDQRRRPAVDLGPGTAPVRPVRGDAGRPGLPPPAPGMPAGAGGMADPGIIRPRRLGRRAPGPAAAGVGLRRLSLPVRDAALRLPSAPKRQRCVRHF